MEGGSHYLVNVLRKLERGRKHFPEIAAETSQPVDQKQRQEGAWRRVPRAFFEGFLGVGVKWSEGPCGS